MLFFFYLLFNIFFVIVLLQWYFNVCTIVHAFHLKTIILMISSTCYNMGCALVLVLKKTIQRIEKSLRLNTQQYSRLQPLQLTSSASKVEPLRKRKYSHKQYSSSNSHIMLSERLKIKVDVLLHTMQTKKFKLCTFSKLSSPLKFLYFL